MSNISTTSGSFIPRIVRIKTVMQMTGLSRSSIYEKINPKSSYFELHFPRPISLGSSAIGWVEHEVQAWINQRIQDRQTREDCA
ncbi:helix-turn-helix transcriptional regulator [Alkanindiges illinoisensis]|uniref:helix-turn-helix transcriptional regulator n=1 Tax=Alkanindiges illinoisensis TaxID=197183 RepID=UPI000A00779A|nr:AlpA family transcriptional regulator [Alkanindiges illinoisensis]